MAESQQAYTPGVCNIGREEIRLRWASGWLGLAVTLVLWGIFAWLGAAAPWRLLLFFPAVLAATGFLQATMHFCANYGMRGVFNFKADVGKTDTVEQAEFRRQDRAKALRIIGLSLLAGAVVALLGYLVPV